MTYENLWDTMKEKLRKKFVAQKAYVTEKKG